MKKVLLTRGMHALVSDKDYKKVMQFKWYASQEGRRGLKFYAIRWVKDPKYGWEKKTKVRMHREIMGLPDGFTDTRVVHHKDGNGLNNQRQNLEILDSNYWNMREAPGWGGQDAEDPFLTALKESDD